VPRLVCVTGIVVEVDAALDETDRAGDTAPSLVTPE
jgi:hypothetical protein